MNLTFDEGKLFYDLYAALLSFVNRKLKVSSEQFSDSREYTSTPPEARIAIRDALFSHRELIDEFARETRRSCRRTSWRSWARGNTPSSASSTSSVI